MARTTVLDHDPWKFSAFISAFSQLLLALLLLLQSIFACLAFQLINFFGLPPVCPLPHAYPQRGSCRCGDVPSPNGRPSAAHACNSRAASTVRGLEGPPKNTRLNRSRSQDWCPLKSIALVCPKCNAAWSFRRRSNFKDASEVFHEQAHWEDGSIEGSTTAIGSSGRGDVSCKAEGVKKNCARHEERLGRANLDQLQEVVKEMQQLQVEELAVNRTIEEAAPTHLDEGEEAVALVLQRQIGLDTAEIECKRALSDSQESPKLSLEAAYCSEAEEYNAANRMPALSTEADCSSGDVILGLRDLLQKEWKMRRALCAELEEERNAAEIAANEAMSMISRLQKEKASLQMESAHYQRIAEEKAIYDDQALQLLKEIVYKKERENFLLEKKAKSFKTRFLREASKKGIEIIPLPSKNMEPMLRLKEASVLEHHQENRSAESDQYDFERNCNVQSGVSSTERSVEESSFALEEQPCKRLKYVPLDEDEIRHSIMIASNGASVCSSEASVCTLEGEIESRQGCQASASPGKQLEQTAGLSVSAINEDETQSILNHLWALEEQLQALGGTEGLEPYDFAQASQNLTVSVAMKSDAGESRVENQSYVGSSSLGFISSPFSESEDTLVARKERGSGLVSNDLINSKGMLKFCRPNASHLDERGKLDVDLVQTSKDMFTVLHDTHKVQVAEQLTNHCLHDEGDGIYQVQEHHLGKCYCSRCALGDALERTNSGANFENLLQVLSSNLDPTDTHYHIVPRPPPHDTGVVSEDERGYRERSTRAQLSVAGS